jgi:hypothetical protein
MRLNGFSLARYEPGDELQGDWSREELEAQNARFAAALERAFESKIRWIKAQKQAQCYAIETESRNSG